MERDTFAVIVREKCANAKRQLYVKSAEAGERIMETCHVLKISTIRKVKYIRGLERLRNFYLYLITEFQNHYDTMTYLVESGNVKDDPYDRSRYEDCKLKIAAILRAKRRIQSKKKLSSRWTLMYLNTHITSQRMAEKYKTI